MTGTRSGSGARGSRAEAIARRMRSREVRDIGAILWRGDPHCPADQSIARPSSKARPSGGRVGLPVENPIDEKAGRRRPEVLAPAGDEASFRAALAAGADAVYLGMARFNARGRADRFKGLSLAA